MLQIAICYCFLLCEISFSYIIETGGMNLEYCEGVVYQIRSTAETTGDHGRSFAANGQRLDQSKKDPSGKRLEKLAEIFGVSRAAILGYSDDADIERTISNISSLQMKLSRLTDCQRDKIEAIVDEMLGDK